MSATMSPSNLRLMRLTKISVILAVLGLQAVLPAQSTSAMFVANEVNVLSTGLLLMAIAVYVVLLATPYFPGAEVGIVIMILFKATGVVLVYFATVLALILAYVAGRRLVKQNKDSEILRKFLSSEETDQLSMYSPFAALVILLNLPGNVVLGGGGGIAMNYGMLNALPITKFIVACTLAILPVPLIFGVFYQL